MSSINASHQVLHPNYVTGLADGEGSFCVSISPRPKLLSGWEVRPSFSLSQNYRSRDILYKLQQFFSCGSVRFSKNDDTWKYEVRSLNDLIQNILPHFDKYKLHTEKAKHYFAFSQVIILMQQEKHRTKEGLQKILQLVSIMNPSGKRKYKSFDEVIVYASGNRGIKNNHEVPTRTKG